MQERQNLSEPNMAHPSMVAPKSMGTSSWGNPVLNILFTIFIVAIVFGVMLVAVATTNTTLVSLQNQQNTWSTATVNSVNAVEMNALVAGNGRGNVILSWLIVPTGISSANPATVTLYTNTVTTAAVNAPATSASSKAGNVYVISLTNTNPLILANTVYGQAGENAIYNISQISVTGLLPQDTGSQVQVQETFFPWANNAAITGADGNTLTATGITTVTGAFIGTTGQTATGIFATMISYLVTLANFTGIIILLAIVVTIIMILYMFFGNRESHYGGL